MPRPVAKPERGLRAFLQVGCLLGCLGTGSELLLLEHYEDTWQLLPLILLGSGILLWGLHALLRRAWPLRLLQIWSFACLAGGLLGVWVHYDGNAVFELEMRPSLAGADLFWRAIQGATPALAPGAVSLLGLLGWGSTWGHPLLVPPSSSEKGTSR